MESAHHRLDESEWDYCLGTKNYYYNVFSTIEIDLSFTDFQFSG